MEEKLNKLSLLIVTWNGDDLLKNCLDSIKQTYGALPETVIADNAASESTRLLVESYENTKYVPLPENLGFAGGNQAAIGYCSREYVILLNNDTIITDDSFSPLADFLDAHPKCGAVQGSLRMVATGNLDGCGAFYDPFGILQFRGFNVPDRPELFEPMRVFAVGGAFFAIRRAAFQSADGLFRAHFRSYYEEIDLCCRLGLAGWECWYLPTPPIKHLRHATAHKLVWSDIQRQYYRNIWFSYLTCYDFAARWWFAGWFFVFSCMQSLVALIKGNTLPIKSHFAAWASMIRERKLVLDTRRKFKKCKKLGDFKFLAFAIQRQPLWHYLELIKRG